MVQWVGGGESAGDGGREAAAVLRRREQRLRRRDGNDEADEEGWCGRDSSAAALEPRLTGLGCNVEGDDLLGAALHQHFHQPLPHEAAPAGYDAHGGHVWEWRRRELVRCVGGGVSGVVEMRGGTLERCSSEISTRFFCLQWAGSRRVGGFRVYDHGPVVACGTGMLAAGVVGASRSPVLAMVICEAGSER